MRLPHSIAFDNGERDCVRFPAIDIAWLLRSTAGEPRGDPDQCPQRKLPIERQEIGGAQVNTTVRSGASQRRFIARSMDVNVAPKAVHVSATIESFLKSLQPKNAMGNWSAGLALPGEPDRTSSAKNCTDGPTRANFLRYAVQAQRSSIRPRNLTDPEFRSRTAKSSAHAVVRGQRPGRHLREKGTRKKRAAPHSFDQPGFLELNVNQEYKPRQGHASLASRAEQRQRERIGR